MRVHSLVALRSIDVNILLAIGFVLDVVCSSGGLLLHGYGGRKINVFLIFSLSSWDIV